MKRITAITPFLWFEGNAQEAVDFYVSLFPASERMDTDDYEADWPGKPRGTAMAVGFKLAGQRFAAINGGPHFTFTPAVSFLVGCNTEEEINYLYEKLSAGGKVLMEPGSYPFAEKYAWVSDKYGVSWQLILAKRPQKITPMLMFTGGVYGRAKEAMEFYTDIFKKRDKESKIFEVTYGEDGRDKSDKVLQGVFSLSGQQFMAMDSGFAHKFNFTPAISFAIECKNQEEINYYWDKLAFAGKPGRCGWLEDKFGVSWQVVPTELNELLRDPDPVKSGRVMRAMLQMKKFDIEGLKKAYANVI